MNVESYKHSIRQIYESAGSIGVSPNLISAREIASVEGDDAMYTFLFELTGMTREDFETRTQKHLKEVYTKVDSSLSQDSFHSMNRDAAKKKMKELQEFLKYHEKLYYTDPENVEISDYEYDMAMKDLEKLEKLHPDFVVKKSVTKRVGFDGGSETQKAFDGSLEKFL